MELNLAAITVPFWNTWSSWEHPHTSPAADGAHSFLAGAGTCAVHLLVSSVKKLVLDLMCLLEVKYKGLKIADHAWKTRHAKGGLVRMLMPLTSWIKNNMSHQEVCFHSRGEASSENVREGKLIGDASRRNMFPWLSSQTGRKNWPGIHFLPLIQYNNWLLQSYLLLWPFVLAALPQYF